MKDKTKYVFSCVRMALNGGETTLLCMSVLFCVNVGLWPVSLPNMWESLGKGREYNASGGADALG